MTTAIPDFQYMIGTLAVTVTPPGGGGRDGHMAHRDGRPVGPTPGPGRRHRRGGRSRGHESV